MFLNVIIDRVSDECFLNKIMNNFLRKMKTNQQTNRKNKTTATNMNSSSLVFSNKNILQLDWFVGRMRDEFQFELFYEKLIKMNHLFTHGCRSTYPPLFIILFSLSSWAICLGMSSDGIAVFHSLMDSTRSRQVMDISLNF